MPMSAVGSPLEQEWRTGQSSRLSQTPRAPGEGTTRIGLPMAYRDRVSTSSRVDVLIHTSGTLAGGYRGRRPTILVPPAMLGYGCWRRPPPCGGLRQASRVVDHKSTDRGDQALADRRRTMGFDAASRRRRRVGLWAEAWRGAALAGRDRESKGTAARRLRGASHRDSRGDRDPRSQRGRKGSPPPRSTGLRGARSERLLAGAVDTSAPRLHLVLHAVDQHPHVTHATRP
jgi:hypothetical protein